MASFILENFWRPVIAEVVEKYLECGDLTHGFAGIPCDHCGHEYLLTLTSRKSSQKSLSIVASGSLRHMALR